MMRKIAIGLAAAAIAVGGSTLSASANYGPMGSDKGYYKGSLGKSIGKSHTHRFGPRAYGMEEREYGPRRGYYDRELERREFERHGFERHGYEPRLSRMEREWLLRRIERGLPLLSRTERERLASRIERGQPLLTRPERERLASRIERGQPLLSKGERERLFSRIEREQPLLSRGERERLFERERYGERGKYEPRLSQLGRERFERYGQPYRYERERYSYRHPMYGHRYERPYAYRYGYERPYGHRYGYERPIGYRHGYERPYGYRYGYERPYGYRYGYEGYKYGPRYYGRR